MVKKPTVLLVLPHPGVDNFAQSLVGSLSQFEFRICAFNTLNKEKDASVWDESKLIKFSGLRWIDLPLQVVKMWRLIRKVKPDVIHTTDYMCAIVIGIFKLFTFSKTPFLLNRHYNRTHHDLNKKHVLIDRILQRIANIVVLVSYAQMDTLTILEKCPPRKLRVIHNGVETERISVDEGIVSSLKIDFKQRSKFSLVAVGRIHPQKDYATLIEAIDYVNRMGYDAHLYVCGNSSSIEQIKLDEKLKVMNLTSTVTFLGYVENAFNYVKACDVFVQSSIDEAFGVSILEALLLEKPLAVTTPAGVIEFVSRFHEFLPSGNPQALGEKIISQINSLDNSCNVCKNKQMEYLRELFDFRGTSQGYANVYRELISKQLYVLEN